MSTVRPLFSLIKTCAWKAALMSFLAVAAALPLLAGTPDLSGTYSADDGGIYYVQQSGSVLWWAGMSLDTKPTPDLQWHRGLVYTNVFRGTINNDNTITGQWADVSRGVLLPSGTLTLSIGSSNGAPQLALLSETGASGGGFPAVLWTQTDPLDDTKVNGNTLDIISRFGAVHKNNADGSSTFDDDNLKAYRDQTVMYGRVVNSYLNRDQSIEETLPHIGYGPVITGIPYNDFSQPARDFTTFTCYDASDADIDMNLNVDTDKLEPDFYTTGWGNRTSGPYVFSLKLNNSAVGTKLHYGAFLHAEALMYGKAANCDNPQDPTYGTASLLPGWGDLYSSSVLINGRPSNGSLTDANCGFIQPCPFLGGADNTNYLVSPIGIAFDNLLLSSYGDGKTDTGGSGSGTYVRLTGALVLDCGHFSYSLDDWGHTCDDDTDESDQTSNGQNQEIHPIYSIDVINEPFRPEDGTELARTNLTGAWGGIDGSTYYIRQVGNTIWWLGMMRDRQPIQRGTDFPIIGALALQPAFDAGDPSCSSSPVQCWAFANVFKGTITQTANETIVEGDWAGVPQSTSAGSSGGHAKFYVSYNKIIVPTAAGIFPVTIEKMYEPEDTTPPSSTLTIGIPQYISNSLLFVSAATPFTVTGTDQDSGMQNIWYRDFPQGGSAPAYTPVIGSTGVFNLAGTDGWYEADTYATDNAGNDGGSNSAIAYLDSTAPVATITNPAATQYGHSDTLTLSYSVSDGSGSGVKSVTPRMDGQTATQFCGATSPNCLDSGQSVYLYSMSLTPHTFSVDSVDNVGNSGTGSVTFTITVTPESLKGDVNNLTSQGCIDNISQSLIAKLNATEGLISKGQLQAAINTLAALVNEVQVQAGKHISTSCKDPSGRSFNPAQLLLSDAQYLQGILAGQLKPNSILGSVVTGNNGIAGATVNLVNSKKTVIATAVTDGVGFYYFADTGGLTKGVNYTVNVTLPKGYKSSTPSSQAFTWQGSLVGLSSFVLN
jgi:SdrD B-like domain